MNKSYLGVIVLIALICASGIYAINSSGMEDLTSAVTSISNNNEILNSIISDNPFLKNIGSNNDLAELGSTVAKETPKKTVDEKGYDIITITNAKGEQHKIHVINENGNKVLRTVTDDMSPEEKEEVMQEQSYWTEYCKERYDPNRHGPIEFKVNNPYRDQVSEEPNSYSPSSD